jgi:urease accessory protein UreH
MQSISERIERKKEQEEKLEKLKSARDRIKKCAQEVFSTAEGKIVLRWLMTNTGFDQPSVYVDPNSGEILPMKVAHWAAKREIYCDIRMLLRERPEILNEVENMKSLEDFDN